MRLLLNGSDGDMDGSLTPSGPLSGLTRSYAVTNGEPQAPAEDGGTGLDIVGLLRRYWLLLAIAILLGAGAGFISVIMSSPMYRSSLMLEVQDANGGLLKNEGGGGSPQSSEIEIQTQINILRGGTFLKRGADRMQSETVPLAPTGRDMFSRIRQRIHPATQDPLEAARAGLNVAVQTFNARPVNGTKLIEMTCESTSPDIAAQFLNSMAQELSSTNSCAMEFKNCLRAPCENWRPRCRTG